MNKYAIAFDVGGHFIKSAVLNERGHVLTGTYAIYPAHSKLPREDILAHFVKLVKQQANRIMDKQFQVYGVGYAFPGPFDYPGGISYIRGVDKFEQLYGVNLRSEFTARLSADAIFAERMTPDFMIVFENDANLFALGESLSGKARQYDRAICLTIGTGAGSAFVERGALITNRSDVPPNGWVYDAPYGESIVDDYISTRGIMRLAAQSGIDGRFADVRAVAELAYGGDEAARGVFHRFGRQLGEVLNRFVRPFRPDAVILGGQIAKSAQLFMPGVRETLEDERLAIETVNDTSISTFAGVAKLLHTTVEEASRSRSSDAG